MSSVFWIKESVNFYDLPQVRLIMNLAEGELILLTFNRLYCEAGKANLDGIIGLDENTPYSLSDLCAILNHPEERLIRDIDILVKYGLLDKAGEGYFITSWDIDQSSDKLAERRRKDRERQQRCREGKTKNKIEETAENNKVENNREEKNRNKEEKNRVEPSRDSHVTALFDSLYDIYPRKGNRDKALECFKTINITDELYLEIKSILKEQISYWDRINFQYIPGFYNYLNDRHWQDKAYINAPSKKLILASADEKKPFTPEELQEVFEHLNQKLKAKFSDQYLAPEFADLENELKLLSSKYSSLESLRNEIDKKICSLTEHMLLKDAMERRCIKHLFNGY